MADQTVLSIFDELKALHESKDEDYAGGEPLSNFKQCEKFGVPAWRGVMVRLSDKFSRLVSLAGKNGAHAVADEGIEDTLRDLAVYSVICLRLWQMASEDAPPAGYDKYRPGAYQVEDLQERLVGRCCDHAAD